MSALRALIVMVVVLLTQASPAFANGTSSEDLTLIESFEYKDNYYIKLSNNSYFLLQKILLHKATGWFERDKYGNPAAGWLIGDPMAIGRTGSYEFPFKIVNLHTQEEAFGVYVNFHMQSLEEIMNTLQQIIDSQQRIQNRLNSLDYNVTQIKEKMSSLERTERTKSNYYESTSGGGGGSSHSG
jgi:hypothetical protein